MAKASILNFFYYLNKSADFFSYVFYTVKTQRKKNFDFLYFKQPYWYTEFIIGLCFLGLFFCFLCCFSFFVMSIFKLLIFVIFSFFLWLILGYVLAFRKNKKNSVVFIFFSRAFSFLDLLFNYNDGKFFCFTCNFVFWYFRAINVPFSFLLKVRFSYERICCYILCSISSVICIFALVPSFTSAGF